MKLSNGLVVVALSLFMTFANASVPVARKGGDDGGSSGKGSSGSGSSGSGNSGSGSSNSGSGSSGSGGGGNSFVPLKANAKNAACAPWYDIRDEIIGKLYHGRCNDLARASVRLAFHDAGTFSLALQKSGAVNGGPDGSLLFDPNEVNRAENNGLQDIVNNLKPLPAKYGVSEGDVTQLAGTLGVVACPGGPQIKTYIGRAKADHVNPNGLLPDTHDNVPNLLARFADMGFSTRELMALIGAHTAARQRFVDITASGNPLDTTVNIWDVRFYGQTANPTAQDRANGISHLPSDLGFAHNATSSKDYARFIGNQDNWSREYSDAHEKMSILGLNKNSLTDCTEMMPLQIDLKDVSDQPKRSIDADAVEVSSRELFRRKNDDDLVVNAAKLEAAIQKYRSIWLNM